MNVWESNCIGVCRRLIVYTCLPDRVSNLGPLGQAHPLGFLFRLIEPVSLRSRAPIVTRLENLAICNFSAIQPKHSPFSGQF